MDSFFRNREFGWIYKLADKVARNAPTHGANTYNRISTVNSIAHRKMIEKKDYKGNVFFTVDLSEVDGDSVVE